MRIAFLHGCKLSTNLGGPKVLVETGESLRSNGADVEFIEADPTAIDRYQDKARRLLAEFDVIKPMIGIQ